MNVTLEQDEYSKNEFGVFAVVVVNNVKLGTIEMKNNKFGVLTATGGHRVFFDTKEDAAKEIINRNIKSIKDKKQYADEKIRELELLLQ
jgi:hypothetical protein